MPYKPYATVFKDPNPKSEAISPVSIYPLTLLQPSGPPVEQTVTFTDTFAASAEWVIPTKLYGTNVSVVVIGAAGVGGSGVGKVTGNINVSTLGTSLGYYVGQVGSVDGGTTERYGGGMASVWSPSLSTYLVVAGGGGSSGASAGASGGSGGNTLPSGVAGSGAIGAIGGFGGSAVAGGAGGTGITANGGNGISVGSPPIFFTSPTVTGGRGAKLGATFAGGNGGEGYYGGGGGGSTLAGSVDGGGGGGSNYANTTYVSSAVGTQGGVLDAASVTFTWLEYP